MDIGNAGLLLVHRHHHVFLDDLPIGLPGHGIWRDLPEVASCNQIIEGLWSFLLVESVLRDDRPQRGQVRSQHRLTGLHDRLVVNRHGN